MIPKEHKGEPLDDATERVIRCIRGGTETHGNADRDLEVHCDSATVDLRCPLKCPICLKNYSWEDIIIDSYFNRVIRTIEHSGVDTRDIMIKSDGSWVADNNGPKQYCNAV